MVTATDSPANGINRIVKEFLFTQVGQHPQEITARMTEDLVVVSVRDVLPPATRSMLEEKTITVELYQQLHQRLLKTSEHILRTRVAGFLQRGITAIHYLFETQPEDLSIIIYLQPKVSAMNGAKDDGHNADDRVQTV